MALSWNGFEDDCLQIDGGGAGRGRGLQEECLFARLQCYGADGELPEDLGVTGDFGFTVQQHVAGLQEEGQATA